MTPELSIAVLGLASNCLAGVEKSVGALLSYRAAGVNIRLVVGENGSTDGTREYLEAVSDGDAIKLLDTSPISIHTSRLTRLAHGREMLRNSILDAGDDIVCVTDLDEGFLAQLSAKTLEQKAFELGESPYFALGASSRPSYYDLLSYVDEQRSYGEVEVLTRSLRRRPVKYFRFFRWLYQEQQRLTSFGTIECQSSFNGLAMYKYDDFSRGSYIPVDRNKDFPLCEHVVFNCSIGLQTGKLMAIDGDLVLETPSEHGRRSTFGFILQRARKGYALLRQRVQRFVNRWST